MGRSRNLGHVSAYHGAASAVQDWFDNNDLSGSAISQVFESRLDIVEDDQQLLTVNLNNEIQRSKIADEIIATNLSTVSSSHSYDLALLSSSALTSRSLLGTSLQAGINVLSSSAHTSRSGIITDTQSNIAALSSSSLISRSLLETSF